MGIPIGIVGLGKIAEDQHLPVLRASSDFDLVAAADPDKAIEGISCYATLAEMLAAHHEIQAVAVCTPPGARYALAKQAIETGHHVLLEKPPGATVSECEALLAFAEDRGVALHAAWHSQHAAAVDAARRWLAERQLAHAQIIWQEDVHRWHPNQDWISKPGGFGVFDPGINALSIMTAIMPDRLRVLGADLQFPANWQTPIAARLAMQAANGAAIDVELDWRQRGEQIWRIDLHSVTGEVLTLIDGGANLADNKDVGSYSLHGEYISIYRRFASLIQGPKAEADLSPLKLVADAFLIGKRTSTAFFD